MWCATCLTMTIGSQRYCPKCGIVSVNGAKIYPDHRTDPPSYPLASLEMQEAIRKLQQTETRE